MSQRGVKVERKSICTNVLKPIRSLVLWPTSSSSFSLPFFLFLDLKMEFVHNCLEAYRRKNWIQRGSVLTDVVKMPET